MGRTIRGAGDNGPDGDEPVGSAPIQHGVVGEFFWINPDPCVMVGPQGFVAWNDAARERFQLTDEMVADANFDVTALFGANTETFWSVVRDGSRAHIECVGDIGYFELLPVQIDAQGAVFTAILFRDKSVERRQLVSLRHLNSIAREVLAEESVDMVLQAIVDDAKELTRSKFSALLILREGSEIEISRFVYNAPRELFPDRLPRAVGLLAVPIETRTAARLDDIRGHELGVGIPVEHPPIGPLLAVPIVAGDQVLGEIAVANQPGDRTFDDVDEALLVELGLHAAQAVRQASAREFAAQMHEDRQAVMDMVRHDLATPVTTAKGSIQLLLDSFEALEAEQVRGLLGALSRSVLGIERLAKNLSADARLHSPERVTALSNVPVTGLLEDLDRDLAPLASQKGIDLVFEEEEDAPRSFPAASLLARQSLENLLTNAIKYSPQGTTVSLTARVEGGSIRFDVRDQGPGIPVDQQGTLFERFHRTQEAISKAPGLGLGLSIVRRVATVHSGTVGVASQPGHGSTFWITFPLAAGFGPPDISQQ